MKEVALYTIKDFHEHGVREVTGLWSDTLYGMCFFCELRKPLKKEDMLKDIYV